MRRIKSINVNVHPSFFEKMETLRKQYRDGGINLSQVKATNILAKNIKPIRKIDLIRRKI